MHFPHILLVLPLQLLELELVFLVLLAQLADYHRALALGLLVLKLQSLAEALQLLVFLFELAQKVFVWFLGGLALIQGSFECLYLLVISLIFLQFSIVFLKQLVIVGLKQLVILLQCCQFSHRYFLLLSVLRPPRLPSSAELLILLLPKLSLLNMIEVPLARMRRVAAGGCSCQFRNHRRGGNVGIEEIIVACLVVETDPSWAEYSCLADVAASVVLPRGLEGHPLGRDVALVHSVDLVGNVVEDYCLLAGSEGLLGHVPYVFQGFELSWPLGLVRSSRWKMRRQVVRLDDVYLRVKHVGYWIRLKWVDGDHVYSLSFAIRTYSYVNRTCAALQMLRYLVLLPRLSFHLLHADSFLISSTLRILFLLFLPLIHHLYFISTRVAPVIRLLLIPRRQLHDPEIPVLSPAHPIQGRLPMLLPLHKCNITSPQQQMLGSNRSRKKIETQIAVLHFTPPREVYALALFSLQDNDVLLGLLVSHVQFLEAVAQKTHLFLLLSAVLRLLAFFQAEDAQFSLQLHHDTLVLEERYPQSLDYVLQEVFFLCPDVAKLGLLIFYLCSHGLQVLSQGEIFILKVSDALHQCIWCIFRSSSLSDLLAQS